MRAAQPGPAAGETRLVRVAGRDEVERGKHAPARPPTTPGSRAWVLYGRYLLDLPGAVYVSQKSTEPDVVRVEFESPELAALARNAVADVVDGARMLMQSPDRPLPPPPGPPYPWNWWDNPANIMRAIAGVRGVVHVERSSFGAGFYAESAAYRDVLRPLFRSRLHDGSYLGWQVWPHPPGGSRPPSMPRP